MFSIGFGRARIELSRYSAFVGLEGSGVLIEPCAGWGLRRWRDELGNRYLAGCRLQLTVDRGFMSRSWVFYAHWTMWCVLVGVSLPLLLDAALGA